jgi:intracellular sulfur oxidation DsrE/DsrF family protein
VFFLSSIISANADPLIDNAKFTGADGNIPSYKAIYQLDQNNPDIFKKAIRNINNLISDPRLAGKIQVELVTFSGATEGVMKGSPYEADIKALIEKGVIVAQCQNSLRERKLAKEQMLDFLGYTPSGNGELVIRATQGWVIVKP